MASTQSTDRGHWLFKSEAEVYGYPQLQRDRRTFWSGVRNYQARNLLRDAIKVGDGVLFYHSNSDPTAIVGIAKVVKSGYPDPTQFDPSSPYHDPDSDPNEPRWFCVDIAPVLALPAPITREQLKEDPALADMMVLRRGARLSVQPVTPVEWRAILAIAGVDPISALDGAGAQAGAARGPEVVTKSSRAASASRASSKPRLQRGRRWGDR